MPGMNGTDGRVSPGVSRVELERRWALARERMRELGCEALVVQGAANTVGIGGHFRWFTGASALTSYAQTAIVPLQGAITLVAHGGLGSEARLGGSDPAYPGVDRRLGTASFPAVHYTGSYDADIVAREIRRAGFASIGLIGANSAYHGFMERLKDQLADVRIVDATPAIDRAKAIKSEEEIAWIRRTAAVQDAVLEKVAAFIRPGLKDFEVMAYAQYVGHTLGSETGYMLGSSAPPGRPAALLLRPLQGREIRVRDIVLVQVETAGPGGFFAHVARFFVLGKTPPELAQAFDAMVAAQDFTLRLLTPGTPCRDIFSAYNAYMRERGFAEETRLHCHGQGYDSVEPPLVRHDEEMTIGADMNIGIHPSVLTHDLFATVCDNFLTRPDGAAERLHRTPRKIFEL
jgi:Xaa-Pro aminopeptidase